MVLGKPVLPVNDNRRQLMELISERPGISLTELRRETPWSNGTLQWHLDVLLRSDRMRSVRCGKRRLYFSSDHMQDPFDSLSELKRSILELLIPRQELPQSHLGQRLGVSASTISRNLKALEQNGWLTVATQGGSNVVRPSGMLEDCGPRT